ncbi:MAG TPA: hypothetical protein VL087_00125 [Nitrospirota bacterium]|nr:hypothetical protein [Nitrospirota bacterium]
MLRWPLSDPEVPADPVALLVLLVLLDLLDPEALLNPTMLGFPTLYIDRDR